MVKRITAKIKRSTSRFGMRAVSVLVAAALVTGTLALTPLIISADSEVDNYPLLNELANSGPTGTSWSYYVHDFAEKPDFKTSDKNFAAPTAEIGDDSSVLFSWEAVSGADSYTVNVYDSSNALAVTQSTGETSLSVAADKFTEGEYQAQIVAYSGNNELSASMVRPFEYSEAVNADSITVSLGGTTNRAVASESNGDSDVLARTPVDFLSKKELGTSATCFLYENMSQLPSNTQAVAFWYSQQFTGDGSYFTLNFQFAWQNLGKVSYNSGTKNAYFIPEGTTGKISVSTIGSNGYTTFDSSKKHGEFAEGWVVVPLSIYTDEFKTKLLNSSSNKIQLYWAGAKNLVNADGTVTTSATGDNRYNYGSHIYAITDLNAFLAQYEEVTDNSYAASAQTDYKCNTYSSGAYYNPDASANKYVIDNGSPQSVSFTLTDDIAGTKGMYLEFTAKKSGYYDLSQKLAVESNSSGVGNIYYRVVRLSDNKTVYPADSDYTELYINGTNPNANLSVDTVYLSEGDKLRLEAYADLTSGSEVKINIGNPTATYLKSADTASGEYISYTAYDYYISNRTSLSTASPYYINDRWEFRMVNWSDGTENPTVTDFAKYNGSWSGHLYDNSSGQIIGLCSVPTNKEGKRIKIKAYSYNAPQLTFTASEAGYVNMNIPISMDNTDGIDVRILKNDEQIWPQSGLQNITSATIKADVAVEAGDKIHIQLYTDADSIITGYTDPVFSFTSSEQTNNSYDEVYSPLWERPYKNESHTGEYTTRDTSLFTFGIVSNGNVTEADSFDSTKGNYLYVGGNENAGFSFGKDDLIFTSSSNSGMYIGFTAPETAKYDLSTALKVVSGKGKATFKITVDDEIVWPESDAVEFTASKGYELDFPALQLNLKMGQTAAVVVTVEPENNQTVKLNLGTPVIYRFANSTYSGSETTDIYTPYCFTAFEDGAVSTRLAAKARFEYLFENASGKRSYADTYNTAEKTVTLSSADTGFRFSETGELTVNISNTSYTHILKYTAPKEISGKLQFEVSSAEGAQVRLVKNGEQIWPESDWYTASDAVKAVALDAEYVKGDVIEWQVKSDKTAEVSLGIPNITDVYHVTDYTDSTTSYSALYGNPFGDNEFTGSYKRYDNELWLYDIADVSDVSNVKTVVPDNYDSSKGNYLYSSKTETGYYFEDVLGASLKNSADKNYGISLGFIAPRTDEFVLRTGLRILSEDTSAKLYVRISVNSETVWCGDSANGWYSKEVTTGEDIDIPLKTLSLTKDDVVKIEVYAEDITTGGESAEDIKITLVSPEIFSEAAKLLSDVNISAKVLYPYDEFQYRNAVYTGEYMPMENRWNYEFAVFGDDDTTVYSPDYYDGKEVKLYSSNTSDSPVYNLKTKTYTLTPAAEDMKGISLRYVSAVDSETILCAVPKITAGADTANVKFRILLNGEKIWPGDNAGTEVISKENPKSKLSDRLTLDLSEGDEILIQFYATSTDEAAQNVTVSMDSFAAVVNSRTEYKTNYSFYGENTVPVQLDPFWSYEYTLDPDNIDWQRASTYQNGYYNIPGTGYCGVSTGSTMIGLTSSTSVNELFAELGKVPIIAITFTAPKEGYYIIGNGVAKIGASGEMMPKIRITQNNEKVWPQDYEWIPIESPNNEFANTSIYAEEGDKIRFEITSVEDISQFIDKDRFRLSWNLTLQYSEFEKVYTSTDDIFNMLTSDMYAYFKALADKEGVEFDIDYAKHLAESLLGDEIIEKEDTDTGSDSYDDTYYDDTYYEDTSSGEWVEGTEDQTIVTEGKRKKTVKHYMYYEYPVLLIVLIIVAAVLVIAAVVIFILHKKGKINWFKKGKKKKKVAEKQ